MKAIFLDKDGTLVDDVSCNAEPRRITLAAGAGPGLRLLARLDYRFFVVTNQDGIAHGHLELDDVKAVAHRLADLMFREQLTLEGFYFCPHHPEGKVERFSRECHCHKPQPGMLLQAAREHGIDLRSSWMIGDILHDIEAGNRAGCRTLLIDNGNETEWRLGARRIPTRMARDLYAAAVLIEEEDRVRDEQRRVE
ncbi:D-glycero-alpha-D-manno-heptose-1,7-bisphosphate 7-phosphatase [Massilia cavernae]|uniref:D,D-heptose 1,7-bisphosphate phosphatase n=1 Tax=Massilia cavernae TaxID=2320864 RepID=A0A418XFZ5_9BURK|nr:HAD-IIIA family hydrolase [Massilia cavernae]RJG11380.1 HAD-IIIA family hydrolase [Massilia cavernae]